METTAPYITLALRKLQRSVWAMHGAHVPQHEQQRRTRLERERKMAAERQRQDRFKSYFSHGL